MFDVIAAGHGLVDSKYPGDDFPLPTPFKQNWLFLTMESYKFNMLDFWYGVVKTFKSFMFFKVLSDNTVLIRVQLALLSGAKKKAPIVRSEGTNNIANTH
jgi:hypothetical protein